MASRPLLIHVADYSIGWVPSMLLVLNTTAAYIPVLQDSAPWAAAQIAVIAIWLPTHHRCSKLHEPGLCPVCFAKAPRNPGAVAAGRARPLLWFVHRFYVLGAVLLFRFRFPETAAIWASTVLVIFGPPVVFALVLPTPWSIFVVAWYLLFTFHAAYRHRQLRDFCPWCPRRGGDDGEQTPDPDPEPSTGRQLEPAGATG